MMTPIDHDDDQTEHSEHVARFKHLLKGEKGLNINEDYRTILRYLYYADFDVDKAFAKMKSQYKMKADNIKWFSTSIYSESQQKALRRNVHCLLPDRDQLGRRVYLLKLGNVVIGEVEPCEMFQTDDLWLELAMDEPETQRSGLVYVIDMKGLSWRYVTYFTPHNCRVGSAKAEGMPIRKLEYHIVNSGVILNSLVTVIFPFLSSSTKTNIFFHKSNMASLHKHVSPDILPAEYGGKLPALDYESLRQSYIGQNETRLKELLSYGYQ